MNEEKTRWPVSGEAVKKPASCLLPLQVPDLELSLQLGMKTEVLILDRIGLLISQNDQKKH